MSRPRSRYDTLERMLNKTTLSLQRVTHSDIIEHGQKAFVQTTSEESHDKEKAIQIAMEQAEARFARELKSMMDRLRGESEKEKVEAMRAQKSYYDKHMAHVAEQRDLLEAERLRELRRQFEMEKESALAVQAAALRQEAAEALEEMRRTELGRAEKQLRSERECEIAAAIRKTEEKCEKQKIAAVAEARSQCERDALLRLNRQTGEHEMVLKSEKERYERLQKELRRVIALNREIESDFLLLQADYKRFLDHTDGQFNSDYMLKLRRHGIELANRELSSLEDVSECKMQSPSEDELL